jgi:hypothetical protein
LAKSKAGVNDAIKTTLSYIWNEHDISLYFSDISISICIYLNNSYFIYSLLLFIF